MKIVALTLAGQQLAQRLRRLLPEADIWYKPKPFQERVQSAFMDQEPMIMICATGIVVRTLAPVIQDKATDPPVLVLDECGQFVIPLLSGHEGGANELGRQVAQLLDAELVLTTANSYLKPIYAVGMGCERGCTFRELEALLEDCLAQVGVSLDQVRCIASIDVKADEDGLLELSESINKPFRTWAAPRLVEVEAQLTTRSNYVYETVGVYGVAESAALVAAEVISEGAAELVLSKQKSRRATCAIARGFIGTPKQIGTPKNMNDRLGS